MYGFEGKCFGFEHVLNVLKENVRLSETYLFYLWYWNENLGFVGRRILGTSLSMPLEGTACFAHFVCHLFPEMRSGTDTPCGLKPQGFFLNCFSCIRIDVICILSLQDELDRWKLCSFMGSDVGSK